MEQMADGDLSHVNPSLLKLCQDPQAWKEARKKALQERVFAKSATRSEGTSAAAFLPRDLPDDEGPAEGSANKPTTNVSDARQAKPDGDFVLQQIMKHKRQRDEKLPEEPAPPKPAPRQDESAATSSGGGLSLKDKLLEKLRKNTS